MALPPKAPGSTEAPILPEEVELGGGFPLEKDEFPERMDRYRGTEGPDHVHVSGYNPAKINLEGGNDRLINENARLEIRTGAGDDAIRTVPTPLIDGGEGKDTVVYTIVDPADAKVMNEAAALLAEQLDTLKKAKVSNVEAIFFDTGDGKAKTFGVVLSEMAPTAEDLSSLKPTISKISDAVRDMTDWLKR